MDDKRETKLIQRAQRGDKNAIAALYDLHYQAVYNYIFYRVSDQPTAEDLSAEVFIRMINKLPGYLDRGRPLLAWLYTIARNLVIDHHRTGDKNTDVHIQDQFIESHDPTPDQQVQAIQAEDCFRQALVLLPESQRQLLIYRFINEFSMPKIVTLMNKSDRAVRSLQHRALRSLEKALIEENCL